MKTSAHPGLAKEQTASRPAGKHLHENEEREMERKRVIRETQRDLLGE